MSDSERDRRRLGDATRQRIDDLADGWSVPGARKASDDDRDAATEEVEKVPEELLAEASRDDLPVDAPTARPKRTSSPPPPPPARAKRTSSPPPPPPARAKRTSSPPPPPPARSKRSSAPPPPPPPRPPAVVVDDEPGEIELDRNDDALTEPVERSEAIEVASSDDDAIGDDDATRFEPPGSQAGASAASGQLRRPQVLPRRRGPIGDVGYVVRVLFKVTEARRELATVNRQIEAEREAREARLIKVARQAIADGDLELPVVERARDELAELEDARAVRAGASAAAEAEISTMQRRRSDESANHLDQVQALEGELADIRQRLEPLEKQAQKARNKAADLHDTLEAIDKKIAAARSSLVAVKGSADPAAVEAEIASLRGEREAVAAEEPPLAAELDDLEPQIAALHAAQRESEKAIADIRERETSAEVRVAEEVEAVRARKAVEDRAVAEADRERDGALLRLGEALAVERPPEVTQLLRPVDEHDLSIATLERRALELSELVGGVDRAAVIRGSLLILAAVAAVVALALFLLLR
jgi:predicted  nucleic acid-binding Zn-ribbon protein